VTHARTLTALALLGKKQTLVELKRLKSGNWAPSGVFLMARQQVLFSVVA